MSEYSLNWARSRGLQVGQFKFVDGQSQIQQNGFDCGVFSLLNAECFIRSWNHKSFSQNAIPLVRLNMIRNIYTFAATADLALHTITN